MYKVVKKFSDWCDVGDVVELNARRAASELRNGNVVKVEKKPAKKKTKEQKFK